MSDIGAMVDQLIAAGTPPGIAAQVVARAFAAGAASANFRGIPVDTTAEKRRAYDRDRKKKLRGIPPDSTGIPPTSETASLSTEIDRSQSKKERKRAEQLPPEWRPDEAPWTGAVEVLGSSQRAEYELQKFKDHAADKGRTSKDWNAAWRSWAKRAVEYGAKNGYGNSQNRAATPAGSPQTSADSILAGMGRLATRVRERQLAERQSGTDPADGDDADGGAESDDRPARLRLI